MAIIPIQIPILATILGIIYLFSPLDFIPDVIPILGWTDDLVVVVIVIFSWLVYFIGESIFGTIIGMLGITDMSKTVFILLFALIGIVLVNYLLNKKR